MVTELKGRYVGKYCRITVLFVPCWMDKFSFLRGQAVGLLHLFCAQDAAYCLCIESLQCVSFDM